MSRNLAEIATNIETQTGQEAQLFLQINYGVTGVWYSTRDLVAGGVAYDGAIVSVGDIKTELKRESSASVSSVSIELSDIYGSIKAGIDTSVFEKTKAVLYLGYIAVTSGVSTVVMSALVTGQIAGPIAWDETNRRISFSIESPIQDKDLGYAPTLQDIPTMDQSAQGIAWPMIFGQCAHVPAVKIISRPEGGLTYPIRLYTATPYNVSSGVFTVTNNPSVLCYVTDPPTAAVIYVDKLEMFPAATTKLVIEGVIFQGTIDGTNPNKFNVTNVNLPKYSSVAFGSRGTDSDASASNVAWMPDDLTQIANCFVYVTDGSVLRFNYCTQQIGRKCWFRYPFWLLTGGVLQKILITSTSSMTAVYPISKNGMIHDYEGDAYNLLLGLANRKLAAGMTDPYGCIESAIDKMKSDAASWWTRPADTIVTPLTSTGDVYVSSLVQLASVQAIYGKRKIKDLSDKTKSVFQPLPQSYYTTQLANGTYTAVGQTPTTITINPPLKTYQDQDWDDVIYVTGTSTIGPNPVSTINWMTTNFTTLSIDSTANSTASSSVRDANFVLFEKREAISVIEEIAWQSRLGLILENATVSLRFLATVPFSPAYVFTDTNIDVDGGYTQGQTALHQVITKYLATWSQDYKERRETSVRHNARIKEIEDIVRSLVPDARRSRSETQYYIYQQNTKQFGTHTKTVPMYIFNEPSPIKEAVDFWGFRHSNVWKTAKLKVFVGALTIQPFDVIEVSMVDQTLLQGNAFLGLVISTNFRYADMSVIIEVVFPVKAGTGAILTSTFWPGQTYSSGIPLNVNGFTWNYSTIT